MKLKNVIALSLLGICGGTTISSANVSYVYAAKDKYASINKEITDTLQQNKGWATGKLDENGSSTDSGTPNDAFNWANYITNIKYTGKNKIEISVTNDFKSLDSDTKKDTISQAENSAAAILLDHKKVNDDDLIKGLNVKILCHHVLIGTSTGHHTYSFH